MTVHSFHIFDRRGKTLFTKRYSQAAKSIKSPTKDVSEQEFLAEQRKLIFGMLFSLRELSGNLTPTGKTPAVYSVKTGATTLHNYETLSGLRLCIYTNNFLLPPTSGNASKGSSSASSSSASTKPTPTSVVKDVLQYIYSNIWVECVIRSPLYRPGELIVGGGADESNITPTSDKGEDGTNGTTTNTNSNSSIISGHQKTFDLRSTNFERKLDAYLSSQSWFR